MGGRQHHRRRTAVRIRLQPAGGDNTPPISRDETWKGPFRAWRAQVVANLELVPKKILGNHNAHRVAANVLGTARAAAVPIEASDRIGPTRFELSAEDIPVSHEASS